ncbi:MAG: hypothetical protein PVJ07_08440 [Anaerolineales bacterium]|jgi:hypothetical protein
MVSLVVVFGMFVVLFAIMGGMRGWAKELLVTSAVVLGLFLNAILETYVESYSHAFSLQSEGAQFLMRGGLLALLVVFGYQTPKLPILQDRVMRERLQDVLLGLVLGAVNGYLFVGSLWFYLHEAGYPTELVSAPVLGSPLAEQVTKIMSGMPPNLLPIPQVYFAVGVIFVFIIVVFV